MNRYLEELDSSQRETLEKIRRNLSDVLKDEHDDRFLLRFLRARSFHQKDTEEMLRKHLRWRKHFGVEYLTKEYRPPEFCDKYLKMAVLGFTREGNLIRTLRMGYSDMKGVMLGVDAIEIEKFFAYILTADRYLMEMNRQQTGSCAESVIYIGDVEGINPYEFPWKYTLSVMIRLVRIFEANFPEHLKAVYMINCPTIMYYVLKALKPFMSEITASKIRIFGSEDYKDVLLKQTDPEVLPTFWGGVRCDSEDDTTCEYLNTKAGKIPESSYLYTARRLCAAEPGIVKVKVEKRNSICVDVEVSEDDCAILWEIDIPEHDIGVGIFYRENSDSSGNLKCVKPVKRHKSQFSPHVGMYICERLGAYVLLLDNRYSYFTDKTVLYRIKVKPPEDHK